MIRMLGVLSLVALVWTARPAVALDLWPEGHGVQGDGLAGVTAVALEFNGFHPDYRRYGLDAERLRGALEGRLAAAGLRIATLDEARRDPQVVMLEVRLRMNRTTYYYYSYNLALRAVNWLPLAEHPGASLRVVAWSQGQVGAILPNNLDRLGEYALGFAGGFVSQTKGQGFVGVRH